MDNNTILERIIEKRQRLDELKAQSPEATEAVQLADEITCLLEQLSGGEQIRYVPYPVYPSYPMYPFGGPYKITVGDATVLNPSSMGGVTTYIAPDTTGKSWSR